MTAFSSLGSYEGGITTYDVTLQLAENKHLMAGMNGTATIYTEEVEQALLLPLTALNNAKGKQFVWLEKDGDAQTAENQEPGTKTVVETGLSDGKFVEIKSGLQEGDVVLIAKNAAEATTRKSENSWMQPDGMNMQPPAGRPGMKRGN